MPEEPIWYNIQVSMRYTLCGEFSENNPRLLNPHEAQRCTKASERGFHEMSGGQFWIHRKKFWVIILTGKDEYTAYVEVSKQTGPPAGHRILWLHFFFFSPDSKNTRSSEWTYGSSLLFYHQKTLWPWENHFNSLNFRFSLCKIRV